MEKKSQSFKIFSLRNALLAVLTVGMLFSIFTLLLSKFYLNSYKLLLERELVAIVVCDKATQSNQLVLNIEFFNNNQSAKKQTFNFNADEWVIESRIIKWKPLLGFFGMQRYYKLERLSGRYLDIEKEKALPRLVYNIADKPDRLWMFFYKYQKCFPFIDAVYGNSAFVQYVPDARYNVYMTATGLMIKDVTPQKKKNWWLTG
ncbi:MAG: hypothetical protein KKD05_02310 [Candidatus Omnitrophica bacterium]|nr:hypothetical protein [Candidatus Omnitrophota bacterium]